ncbi:MAG: hypothetical protein AAFO70_00535 [Pseudomonadota bacterium]
MRMAGLTLVLMATSAPAVAAANGELDQLLAMHARVQDEAARGAPAAVDLKGQLRLTIVTALDEGADADVERLAQFALSGGRSRSLQERLAKREDALSKAVVALMGNRMDVGRDALAGLDTTGLTTRTKALIALNRALLVDPAQARPLLLRATALAPGTIVEEAALRRLVLAENRDAGLAARYWRRFAGSPYHAGLEAKLLDKLKGLQDDKADAFFKRLVSAMPRETASRFAVSWTRHALLAARPAPARVALKAARTFDSAKSAIVRERNRLMARVSDLASADTARVLRQLGRIDPSKLHEQDRAMLDASKQVARAILAPLPPAGIPPVRWQDSAIADQLEQIDRLLND